MTLTFRGTTFRISDSELMQALAESRELYNAVADRFYQQVFADKGLDYEKIKADIRKGLGSRRPRK